MCHAITKSGKVCKIKTTNHFCHIHSPVNSQSPLIQAPLIQAPLIETTIEEKREGILQRLLRTDIAFQHLNYQREAWPLFKDIDLTSETVEIINRAKYVCNWGEDIYNTVISAYFDDSIGEVAKYDIIRDKIKVGLEETAGLSFLKEIQRMELYKDMTILYVKVGLSLGTYSPGIIGAKSIVDKASKFRTLYINEYRENNLNKLMINITKKHTPICDDVCNYIIAQYL